MAISGGGSSRPSAAECGWVAGHLDTFHLSGVRRLTNSDEFYFAFQVSLQFLHTNQSYFFTAGKKQSLSTFFAGACKQGLRRSACEARGSMLWPTSLLVAIGVAVASSQAEPSATTAQGAPVTCSITADCKQGQSCCRWNNELGTAQATGVCHDTCATAFTAPPQAEAAETAVSSALGRAMHDFMAQLAHDGCAPQAIATRAKECLPDQGMLKEACIGSMGSACREARGNTCQV